MMPWARSQRNARRGVTLLDLLGGERNRAAEASSRRTLLLNVTAVAARDACSC